MHPNNALTRKWHRDILSCICICPNAAMHPIIMWPYICTSAEYRLVRHVVPVQELCQLHLVHLILPVHRALQSDASEIHASESFLIECDQSRAEHHTN